MGGEQRKFELTGPQIVGSTLAAVSAAVAASYLGVAGTVIGAALVSAATTVGTAVYTHYLRRTGEKVKQHTVAAWREHAAEDVADGGPSTPLLAAERSPRRRLPWARVAAAAALVFAVSMGSILAYQGVAGRTVADQITGKPKKKAERDRPPVQRDKNAEPAPQESPTPSATTSSADLSPSPASSPSPTPTPTPTQTPSGEPASTSTAANTLEPSGSPSPEQSRNLPEVSADPSPPDEPQPRRDLLRLPAVIGDDDPHR